MVQSSKEENKCEKNMWHPRIPLKFKNKKLIYTKNLRVTHKLLSSMNTQFLSYQSKVPIHLLIHDIISRAMQGVTRTCQLQPLQCVEFLENQNELDCLTIQNFCVKLPHP